MTGYLRDRPVGQVDELLINGKRFKEEQIKEVLKDVEPYKKSKGKKK